MKNIFSFKSFYFLIVLLTFTVSTFAVTPPSGDYYRSKASGNWSSLSTWERSTNSGSTWTATVSAYPTSSDGNISIQNTHTVTVDASISIDETTVNGTLVVGGTYTLTVANGSGTDLTVSGTLTINAGGYVTNNGSITLNTSSSSVSVSGYFINTGTVSFSSGTATMTVNNGGFVSAQNRIGESVSSTGGRFDLLSGATLEIFAVDGLETSSGYLTSNSSIYTRNFTFYVGANYTYRHTGDCYTGDALPGQVNNLTVMISGPSNKLFLSKDLIVDGTLTLVASQGLFDISDDALTIKNPIAGTPTNLIGNSNSDMTIAGTVSGVNIPSSITELRYLTLNNAWDLPLQGNLIVNNTLTLSNGKVTLGTYNLTVGTSGSSGSISGASSSRYIITNGTGYLKIYDHDFSPDVTFPVGTASAYSPVAIGEHGGGPSNVKETSGTTITYEWATARVNGSNPATYHSMGDATNPIVNMWFLDGNLGGSHADITFQYPNSMRQSGFTQSQAFGAKWNGSTDWTSYRTSSTRSGDSNPSTVTVSDVSTFSNDWGIFWGTTDSPLLNGWTISGYVYDHTTAVSGVTITYTGGSTTTNGSGFYSFKVDNGWSGTVTPSLTNYTFNPTSRSYTNVTSDQTNQNFLALRWTISGNTQAPGVTVTWTGAASSPPPGIIKKESSTLNTDVPPPWESGSVVSDGSGNYSFMVTTGWQGTVTATKTNLSFKAFRETPNPPVPPISATNATYTTGTGTYLGTSVSANKTTVDFTAWGKISGTTHVYQTLLSYYDLGGNQTVTSDDLGFYSIYVSYNWTGTVTPTKLGYTFTPTNILYRNVIADTPNQDYGQTDGPVLTLADVVPASYTENAVPVQITNTISIVDDATYFPNAYVKITTNFQNTGDQLSLDLTMVPFATYGITGTWNNTTGTLTLSGNATVPKYQAALRAVKFSSTSENPSALQRTITFQVTDGTTFSNIATKLLNVVPVNDAPVQALNTGASILQGGTLTITNAMLNATDVDNTNTQLVYTVTTAPVNGVLQINALTVTSFTQQNINDALVKYVNNGNNNRTDSFVFTLGDGAATLPAATFNITVVALLSVPTGITITYDQYGNPIITWQYSGSGQDGFKIYRDPGTSAVGTNGTLNTEAMTLIATVGPTVLTYTDLTALEGVAYTYSVVAYKGTATSDMPAGSPLPNPGGKATLKTPTNLAAAVQNTGKIVLTWTDNSSIEDGYIIERSSPSNTSYTELIRVAAGVTTYTNTGLTNGVKYYYRIATYKGTDKSAYSNEVNGTALVVGVAEEAGMPTQFALFQNYPNPFNPSTNIRFDLPKESYVTLKVYNILGAEVATLVDRVMSAGHQSITFDASKLSSGLYIYRIQANDYLQIKKMMLMK